jgi:hypothetical protein
MWGDLASGWRQSRPNSLRVLVLVATWCCRDADDKSRRVATLCEDLSRAHGPKGRAANEI